MEKEVPKQDIIIATTDDRFFKELSREIKVHDKVDSIRIYRVQKENDLVILTSPTIKIVIFDYIHLPQGIENRIRGYVDKHSNDTKYIFGFTEKPSDNDIYQKKRIDFSFGKTSNAIELSTIGHLIYRLTKRKAIVDNFSRLKLEKKVTFETKAELVKISGKNYILSSPVKFLNQESAVIKSATLESLSFSTNVKMPMGREMADVHKYNYELKNSIVDVKDVEVITNQIDDYLLQQDKKISEEDMEKAINSEIRNLYERRCVFYSKWIKDARPYLENRKYLKVLIISKDLTVSHISAKDKINCEFIHYTEVPNDINITKLNPDLIFFDTDELQLNEQDSLEKNNNRSIDKLEAQIKGSTPLIICNAQYSKDPLKMKSSNRFIARKLVTTTLTTGMITHLASTFLQDLLPKKTKEIQEKEKEIRSYSKRQKVAKDVEETVDLLRGAEDTKVVIQFEGSLMSISESQIIIATTARLEPNTIIQFKFDDDIVITANVLFDMKVEAFNHSKKATQKKLFKCVLINLNETERNKVRRIAVNQLEEKEEEGSDEQQSQPN